MIIYKMKLNNKFKIFKIKNRVILIYNKKWIKINIMTNYYKNYNKVLNKN